jgi:hypothetical protein
MSATKSTLVRPVNPGRGHAVAELRKGSASGPHGKRRRDRANSRRKAIAADRDAG